MIDREQVLTSIQDMTFCAVHADHMTYTTRTRPREKQVLSRESIDLLHPALWECLHNHINYWSRFNEKYGVANTGRLEMSAATFFGQLTHLTRPFWILDRDNTTIAGLTLTGITYTPQADTEDINNNGVVLRVRALDLATRLPQTLSHPEQTVPPFVLRLFRPEVCPTTAWLNEQFPGWKARLSAAAALDCSDEETLRFLQDVPASDAVDSLPDMPSNLS